MTPGYPVDQPLFSTDMMEGEYTTWAHLWTIDAGLGDSILVNWVDNYGWCYWYETAPTLAHVTDRAGADTTTANLYFSYNAAIVKYNEWASVNRKYVIGLNAATQSIFRVFRRGAVIFTRNITLDEPASDRVRKICMSRNGRYIFIVGGNPAGDDRYAMLYEAP